LKSYKSPGGNKISAELIQAGGKILRSENYKLNNSVWNEEELPDQWKESIMYQFIRIAIKLNVVIIVGYHRYQPHTKCYPSFFSQS
jgi:hypothetical protein